VRAKIQVWADAAASDYKSAAERLKQSGAPPALGDTGDSAVLNLLKDAGLKAVAETFSDDKLCEKTFNLSPDWLRSLVGDTYEASRVDMRNEVPASVFVNYPTQADDPFNGRWLYTNRDGTYKVYLNVKSHRIWIE
jgi:hypothetical protein